MRPMEPLPVTEARAGQALDLLEPRDLAARFAREDARAAAAVAAAGEAVGRAIGLAAAALEGGGRVVLAGAGTSGRLAVLEAAECRPTFSSDRVVAVIAGGPDALLQAREGAEDDRAAGGAAARDLDPGPADLFVGVSASGRTPWVLAAVEAAAAAGARTGLVVCAPPPAGAPPVDLAVVLDTGPEALAGSTRLKAGTATKCVLNAITTGAMARCGKVLDDLMVDVAPTNAKLRRRAARIVSALVPGADARRLLEAAGWEVKAAVVMGRRGLDAEGARERLAAAGGHLRRALDGA